MTPARSLVGTIVSFGWMARFRTRALVFGTLIALFAVLAVFPQRQRAAVTLTPTDPTSLGLSGALGQLGALNSVFGNQAAVEVALRVAHSYQVRNIVIDETHLEKRLGKSRLELHRWLDNKVTTRSLRGGIIQTDMQYRDGALALEIVGSYAKATRERLSQISLTQTAYKRDVLEKLVAEAQADLAKAQEAYDNFRLQTRTPTPEFVASTVTERILMLESAIKAKEIELTSARQLYTEDNMIVLQMKTAVAALQHQLEEVKQTQSNEDGTVGRTVAQSSTLFKLERDLYIQRTLYDGYLRFLEGTAVENLTSSANVRVLEPPFIDTERQFWWPAVAGLAGIALLWGAIEFYRLRPPVGARIGPEVA